MTTSNDDPLDKLVLAILAVLDAPEGRIRMALDMGGHACDEAFAALSRVIDRLPDSGSQMGAAVYATWLVRESADEALREMAKEEIKIMSRTPGITISVVLLALLEVFSGDTNKMVKDLQDAVNKEDDCACEACTLRRTATAEIDATGKLTPETRVAISAMMRDDLAAQVHKETIQ